MSCAEQTEYRRVLRVTALLGSTRALTMVVGLARAKGLALSVGAAGIGLLGFGEIALTFMVYLFGLGVSSSGVRFLALARDQEGETDIAGVARMMRLLSLCLGLVAGLCWVFLWRPVSMFSLGYHEELLRWIGPSIAFVCVSSANRACLQGLQVSRLVALTTFVDAAAISLSVVVLALLAGRDAILIGYLVGAAASCFFSEWMLRKVIPRQPGFGPGSLASAGPLIKLGIGMTSGLLVSTALLYGVQTLVARRFGLEGVGIYLCAFALSGKAIGFILDTMRMDFFPSLSRASRDHVRAKAMIAQQTEILLLFALPGLLLTLALSPLLVRILYSAEFSPAVPILQVFVLGAFFRVLGSPVGMIRVSRGHSGLYVLSEILISSLAFLYIYLGVYFWGLVGVAWGYLVGSFSQVLILTLIARRLTSFRWSRNTLHSSVVGSIALGLGFASIQFIPPPWGTLCGILLAGGALLWALRLIGDRLGPDNGVFRRLRAVPGLKWLLRRLMSSRMIAKVGI